MLFPFSTPTCPHRQSVLLPRNVGCKVHLVHSLKRFSYLEIANILCPKPSESHPGIDGAACVVTKLQARTLSSRGAKQLAQGSPIHPVEPQPSMIEGRFSAERAMVNPKAFAGGSNRPATPTMGNILSRSLPEPSGFVQKRIHDVG